MKNIITRDQDSGRVESSIRISETKIVLCNKSLTSDNILHASTDEFTFYQPGLDLSTKNILMFGSFAFVYSFHPGIFNGLFVPRDRKYNPGKY